MKLCVYPTAIKPGDVLIEDDGATKTIFAVDIPEPPAVVVTLVTDHGPRFAGMLASLWIERT